MLFSQFCKQSGNIIGLVWWNCAWVRQTTNLIGRLRGWSTRRAADKWIDTHPHKPSAVTVLHVCRWLILCPTALSLLCLSCIFGLLCTEGYHNTTYNAFITRPMNCGLICCVCRHVQTWQSRAFMASWSKPTVAHKGHKPTVGTPSLLSLKLQCPIMLSKLNEVCVYM
jgi:hypothetical protein